MPDVLQPLKNPRLDRRIEFDERSRNFPSRSLIPVAKPLRSYTWGVPQWLDQGTEGACAGFAVTHEALARPVCVPNLTEVDALKIYKRAQQIDQWPGENYSGTSVLAAMKAGVERGWYKEYRWAFGIHDVALAIGYAGPLILGIPWYTGMMTPDSTGLIKVTGIHEGDHAIVAPGYGMKTNLYRLHNSWGRPWGFGGDCFIHWDDLARLLGENGEACVPVKRSLA